MTQTPKSKIPRHIKIGGMINTLKYLIYNISKIYTLIIKYAFNFWNEYNANLWNRFAKIIHIYAFVSWNLGVHYSWSLHDKGEIQSNAKLEHYEFMINSNACCKKRTQHLIMHLKETYDYFIFEGLIQQSTCSVVDNSEVAYAKNEYF